MGGEWLAPGGGGGVYGINEEYDPQTNTWTTRAPIPTPRHGIGCSAIGDTIYVAAGGPQHSFAYSSTHEAFIPALQTGVSSDAAAAAALHQSYPNPFSESTVIEYDVLRPSQVTLKIYDVRGAEVQTLAAERQLAGRYQLHLGRHHPPRPTGCSRTVPLPPAVRPPGADAQHGAGKVTGPERPALVALLFRASSGLPLHTS